jgi:hypothetical protein
MGSKEKSKTTKGKHWSIAELNRLFEIIENVLPRGANEWTIVAERYNSNRPRGFVERDEESMRNKFKSLRNVKKPTGDPLCPEEVRRAKRIQREIEAKIGVETLDDNMSMFNEDLYDNDEQILPIATTNVESYSTQLAENADNYIHSPVPSIPESFMVTTSQDMQLSSSTTAAISSPSTISNANIKSNKTTMRTITKPKTTLRTGYNEEELIQLSDMSTSNLPISHSSEATRKRSKLDKAIEELVSTSSNRSDFLQMYLIESQKREDRREEREDRYHRERLEREERDRRYQHEREETRRQEEIRREERFNAMLIALLGKSQSSSSGNEI